MAQTPRIEDGRRCEIYGRSASATAAETIVDSDILPGPGYPVREAVSTGSQAGRQEGRKSLGRPVGTQGPCRTHYTRYQIICKFNTLTVRSAQSTSKTIVARWSLRPCKFAQVGCRMK
ncbi:unnamed protein product [Lasius platythorax]|uniref:Uncharacterized protein n=1 Tax=Lasius platythorax TaxID=488582 RepID=A0AAV2NED0_9HYME